MRKHIRLFNPESLSIRFLHTVHPPGQDLMVCACHSPCLLVLQFHWFPLLKKDREVFVRIMCIKRFRVYG